MGKKNPVAIHITPYEEPKGYAGSWEDHSDDRVAAARRAITSEEHDGSARDRVADTAGEYRKRNAEKVKAENPESEAGYQQGKPAFANRPKSSHGFGHKDGQRSGHLRMSGHSGAHRIGGKKR